MLGAAGSNREPAVPRGAGLVERLRAVHLEMVDAVLGGDGLDRVAALAADAAGAPVAIVIPRLGAAAAAPSLSDDDVGVLRRYVADRVKDRPEPSHEARRSGRSAGRGGAGRSGGLLAHREPLR